MVSNCLKYFIKLAQNDTFQSISNIHKVVSTYIDPIYMHMLYHKYVPLHNLRCVLPT